jgi:hypothetical protein
MVVCELCNLILDVRLAVHYVVFIHYIDYFLIYYVSISLNYVSSPLLYVLNIQDHEQLSVVYYLYSDLVSSMDFNYVYSCSCIGSKFCGSGCRWSLLV